MSETPEDLPVDEVDTLTDEQAAIQKSIDTFNSRQALLFNHFVEGINKMVNQYSEQCQITIELLREEYGVTPSPQAAQYKEMMDQQTEVMRQQQADAIEAAKEAASEAAEAGGVTSRITDGFDPTGQGGE